MVNKNFNTGLIQTNGGNVHVGDNYFDGFPILLTEYKLQLEDIKGELDEFKVKSVIPKLDKLEKKVNENLTHNCLDRNAVLSKIFYFRALALSELDQFDRFEISKLFISAYKINENDLLLRDKACLEYLNLQEDKKAFELADKILESDEFNFTAWFVKTLLSDDIKCFIKSVPNSVKSSKSFSHSLIYNIIRKETFNSFDELEEYNLKYDYNDEDFKKLTFDNKNFWEVNLDLLINKFLSESPSRYISGESNIYDRKDRVENIFQKLERYYNTLKDTEVTNIKFHRFYYFYFRYVLYNSALDAEQLVNAYEEIIPKHWILTIFLCQVLNHQKDFKTSLQIVSDYEIENNPNTEILLLKGTILRLNGREDELLQIIFKYISQIDIVDEINTYNLFATFFPLLPEEQDRRTFEEIKSLIIEKPFLSDELRNLFILCIDIRYIKDFDSYDVQRRMLELSKIPSFANSTKLLIAQFLEILGERKDALALLETFVKIDEISTDLRLYIAMLINHLHDKNINEVGLAEKVLSLLKFWRSMSPFHDDYFVNQERNLYIFISDYNSLVEIDSLLLTLNPNIEKYQYAVVVDYDKLKDLDKLEELSGQLNDNFDSEEYGVRIAHILLKNNINRAKAFNILYYLASAATNIQARKLYFLSSNLFDDFLVNYDVIVDSSWVEYEINGSLNKIKLTTESEYYEQLSGKKIDDAIIINRKFSKKKLKGKIIAVYNDAVCLMKEIMNDIHNPINDFGFESINFPIDNPEEFNKQLIELFGDAGTQQKQYRESQLNKYSSYHIGFTEISLSLFRSNYIDAYLSLTFSKDYVFTTLLSESTGDINGNNSFSIDYSTILLLYFLEKELGFEYIHKFIVPFSLVEGIERELDKEKTERESKMSIEITKDGLHPHFLPDNFKEQRIDFLKSVLAWINSCCTVDLVKEKNDYLPKLLHGSHEMMSHDDYRIFLDSLLLSQRKNQHLISSDSTIFVFFRAKANIQENFVNPEKYLRHFYPDKCNLEFYRYLLKHNYLSINISEEILKSEFENYISKEENFYFKALKNIQYYIHQNEVKYNALAISFIEYIYLKQNLDGFWKGRHSFDFLRYYLFGMDSNGVNNFCIAILTKFDNEHRPHVNNLIKQLTIIRNVLLKK